MPGLWVQEDEKKPTPKKKPTKKKPKQKHPPKKITKALKTFWHLREAAHEGKQVLSFWANTKASLMYAKEQGYI